MSGFHVHPNLKTNYDNYYDGSRTEWRRLTAKGKVGNIVNLSTPVPHKTILEIGSGDGVILDILSGMGFGEELYSLEISETAAKSIEKLGIKSLKESALYDGYNIPYEDKRFDLVVMSHIIEHVEYPRKLLYEAGRVAEHVFIEVPLEHNSSMPADFKFDRVGHINFYSRESIRWLVQSCGYQIKSQIVTNSSVQVYRFVDGIKGIPKFLLKELAFRLAPSFATRKWTYHSAVICLPSVAAYDKGEHNG